MDAASSSTMATLRLQSVPCKKRPLSWYKPPVSPDGSPVGPVSPASSTSSSHEDAVVAPTAAPTSRAPLLWPVVMPTSTAVLHAMARSLVTTSTLGAFGTLTPQQPPVRRQSDFSIEHILRDAGPTSSSSPPSSPDPASSPVQTEGHFEWLQCTRYRPPKLPRSRRRDGPAQRRLGRNPRIPFSPQQVSVLEGRFRRSHYLSSADVADLSAQLELSETRVKIWFQNRRARERRDGGEGRSATRATSPGPVPPVPVPQAPLPSLLPRSPVSAFSAPKSQARSSEETEFTVAVS